MVIYEPTYPEDEFFNSRVIRSLHDFKEYADLIISNRKSEDLVDVDEKVFSRDLFGNN